MTLILAACMISAGATDGAQYTIEDTFLAICFVESTNGRNPKACKELPDTALGWAQIRRCVVVDCNRILGRPVYRLEDRRDLGKCFAMFRTYCGHYYPNGNPEQWSRSWNGGPRGPRRSSTLAYWAKVQKALREQRAGTCPRLALP